MKNKFVLLISIFILSDVKCAALPLNVEDSAQLSENSVHFGEKTQLKTEQETLKPDSVLKNDEAENILKFKSEPDYEEAEVLKRGGGSGSKGGNRGGSGSGWRGGSRRNSSINLTSFSLFKLLIIVIIILVVKK